MINTQRAQEICESSKMAHVSHNGSQIYIQRVDKENETARVYPLDNPEQELDVPLASLDEHHS